LDVNEWKEKLRVMKSNAGSDPSNNPNHAKRDSFATKVAVVTGCVTRYRSRTSKRLIANGYRVVQTLATSVCDDPANTADLKLVDGDMLFRRREASSRHRGPEFLGELICW